MESGDSGVESESRICSSDEEVWFCDDDDGNDKTLTPSIYMTGDCHNVYL